MDELSEVEVKKRRLKLRILGMGLILIFISLLMLQFFVQMRYPPELKLPIDLRPDWTSDVNRVKTMQFVGDVGIVIGWVIFLVGLVLVVYGFINTLLDPHLRVPRRFEQTITEAIKTNLVTDRNFFILFVGSVIFGIIWFFNLLTYPDDGPLYFLREPNLQAYYPTVPVEDLPALSTYGGFAVIQDTAILILFIYVIYVRLRPGKQFAEDFVSFALDRTAFLVLLIGVSIFHAVGHLPYELYGKGQWGTGFTDINSWIAFDKIAHGLTSAAITMLIVYIVTDQFANYGAESTSAKLFGIVVAIAFMISLGLAWEIFEWITNALLNLGHFIDEILDAPKDLVWDAIGAVLGACLAVIDMYLEKAKPETAS
ncbi:hypothetical protein CEE45_06205 [Candidatus Heimdallarchaeota archaeon B3_Heim]|nr:MAG: hypothetical protein CEE45_06205 [Candidatus Heimdallarchaeota archaeon B3_Heim]